MGGWIAVSQDDILAAGTCGKYVSVWHTETCERVLGMGVGSFMYDAAFTSHNRKLLLRKWGGEGG